jgi:hypothetical protein
MRRALLSSGVLAALLAGVLGATSVFGAGGAGFNPATKKLERAFKIALLERKNSPDGCYPAPKQVANALRSSTNLKVAIGTGPNSAHRSGVVYVLKRRASCDNLFMATRLGRSLYILDSAEGKIALQGRHEKVEPGQDGPLRGLTVVTKSFRMTKPDETARLEVLCPGKSYPLGGGMIAAPPSAPDGEGAYPHSFERLGAQRGFHVSPVLYDPGREGPVPRNVTLQATCGKGVVPANPPPHKTVFIKSGQTKTALARCPKGQVLVSGGFQRTDFRSDGGDYVTESRAIGPNAWRATGSAFGGAGGELTAIAYCVKHKSPMLTEVASPATPIAKGTTANATTAQCPPGTKITSGGFSENGSINAFFANGGIDAGGSSWTASAFAIFGDVPGFTAYGYCMKTG